MWRSLALRHVNATLARNADGCRRASAWALKRVHGTAVGPDWQVTGRNGTIGPALSSATVLTAHTSVAETAATALRRLLSVAVGLGPGTAAWEGGSRPSRGRSRSIHTIRRRRSSSPPSPPSPQWRSGPAPPKRLWRHIRRGHSPVPFAFALVGQPGALASYQTSLVSGFVIPRRLPIPVRSSPARW